MAKVNEKRVFDFALILGNGNIKTEPVPVFQFMTDQLNDQSFSAAFNLFLRDEKKNTVPKITQYR